MLPGGEERHWQANTIENAFLQSVRWREPNKITDRTLTLANRLNSGPSGIVSLLIELAPRKDHPWNAIFLDNRLYRWKAWERDRNWTMTISQDGVYDEHPVNRLLDWCANAPKESADKETLHLCALTLCWLFCSTAPSVRDRATKALSSLLTDCPDLFPELMAHFVDADDLYLIERLLAAGYGTLIRHPDLGHATHFASSVIQHTFRKKGIPPNLLLRDYAAGIVESAEDLGAIDGALDVSVARPPYRSSQPRFNASKASVERIAKKAGGDNILHSCSSELGDFYGDEIRHPNGNFHQSAGVKAACGIATPACLSI